MSRILAKALLALFLFASPALAGDALVLIVSADSKVQQLDSLSIRRLFLGLTVIQNGRRLRPVLNETDSRIKEIFLQNIVAMSDSNYDRYLLRRPLLEGQSQPVGYDNAGKLTDAIAADPDAVSYAWEHDVGADARIRILRILWHD